MRKRHGQRGFTLIEVTLAIVLGVTIMAGGVALYQSARVNAGNSKAQTKVHALAAVVEESSALSEGSYPTLAQVQARWPNVSEDAHVNPWGGSVQAPSGLAAMGNSTNATALTGAAWDAGGIGWTAENVASAGVLLFASVADFAGAASTTSVLDSSIGETRTYQGYVVGVADPRGEGPAFTTGGH